MNVLHINQSDIEGGAAIAAFRLHNGLLASGIESRLLTGRVTINDPKVTSAPSSPAIEKQTSRLAWRLGLNYVNLHSTFRIRNHPFFAEADIVNFHNLHGSYFNYLALPSLTKAKAAVWTLHDMWGLTGHCAYSLECLRWKSGCGRCPHLDVDPPVKIDNTRIEWKLKKWTYARSRLTVVTPSAWLAALARESLLSRFEVIHIPNGIDTGTFRPHDRDEVRAGLGIRNEKRVMMFASQNLNDPRKGGDLLHRALELLPASLKSNALLLTVGGRDEGFHHLAGIEAINLGYLEDDESKARAYSAADVFVLPTRSDNLPLVLQESMACGTPCVAFSVGGVGELVRPGLTGFLATPADPSALARSILEAFSTDRDSNSMRAECREIAVREYDIQKMVAEYSQLYLRLTEQDRAQRC